MLSAELAPELLSCSFYDELMRQLRDERAKRRHAHDRTRARALSHALGLTCLCARVRHRELESCGAPVRLNCSIGDEFS